MMVMYAFMRKALKVSCYFTDSSPLILFASTPLIVFIFSAIKTGTTLRNSPHPIVKKIDLHTNLLSAIQNKGNIQLKKVTPQAAPPPKVRLHYGRGSDQLLL
jgi:hypothetical protein